MPSDTRIATALAALARPIAEFRTALAGALEQAQAWLAAEGAGPVDQAERFRLELGPFAEGRLDAGRFATVFGARQPMPAETRARLQRAVSVLEGVLGAADDLFVATVPPAGSLGRTVGDALSRAGRAFGAVLAVELLRGNRFDPAQHEALFGDLDFRAWTRSERRYAPPLVVRVDGADLQAGSLADYLDGREKLVLVVDGPCAPASLVRLVTPGTLVLQTIDGTGLDRVALAAGPAVAAMVPEGAATFLHDPATGRESWQRLSVWSVPDAPRKPIGGASVWQMKEDLRQLESLAAAPIGAPLPADVATAAHGGDAVDQLASWLLRQSGLTGAS
jgi:hypothetical protein